MTTTHAPAPQPQRILDAARALFGTKGYAATSIRDIAGRAEISIAGMYHHFATKEAILAEITNRAVDDLLIRLRAAREGADGSRNRLRAMLRATIDAVLYDRTAFRIMLESTDALTDEHFEIVRRKRSEAVEIVRREVSRALADSPSSDLDPTIVTFAVNGMANWLFFWFDPDGRLSVEEVADQLERLLFEGIPPAEE